ncbi:hypothetical protein [Glaciibacter superstes]|uniref:hypothetical protein n=1 Tax=Glaciibacter superstes TaxID=501023 RepID=UPI0003B41DAB|nr:hypothetical protein [Glaciibacter superstes]
MLLPIRLLKGSWPRPLERWFSRFVWSDPLVILRDDVSEEDFRAAMSAIHVGDTIKITGRDRHPVADDLLIENVELSGATIVDIGASDGSTSVDLIRKLDDFARYIMADLFFEIDVVEVGRHSVFFDNDGNWILTVGHRILAWPADSALVRLVFGRSERRARRPGMPQKRALLLGPAARELMRRDQRINYRVHDIFTPWDGPAPTVVKVANLLRRLYFSDEVIVSALQTLLGSLTEGAYLLIVDNSRIPGMGPRAGLYQRDDGKFTMIAETPDRPEIADLVGRAQLTVFPLDEPQP